MSAALGFAYLNLAATQTRYAVEYFRRSGQFVNASWLAHDILEWSRLKREARAHLEASSRCNRPRLP